MLQDKEICARSFEYLQHDDVAVRLSFQLLDGNPIYYIPRRMSPEDNLFVRGEVEKVLRAGIMKPATSACYFLVVITTMQDGSPSFCVKYRLVN